LLAIESTGPGILYLLQDGKICRSLDGAESWREARAATYEPQKRSQLRAWAGACLRSWRRPCDA
jgi:hypothetical protein